MLWLIFNIASSNNNYLLQKVRPSICNNINFIGMDHFNVKQQEQFSNPCGALDPKICFFQQNSPTPLLKHIACISFYLFYQNVNFHKLQNYAKVSITCFMTEFDGEKVYSSFDVINCFVCTFTISAMQCSLWCQMRNIPMPPVIRSWNKWCLACRKCQHFIEKKKKKGRSNALQTGARIHFPKEKCWVDKG